MSGDCAVMMFMHENLVRVEDVVVVHVADLAHGIAHDLHVIELRLGRDLAADDDDVALRVGLAGHAAVLVLREAGVEHGVGNGVANFVGMAFADGFGGEDVTTGHARNGWVEDGLRVWGDRSNNVLTNHDAVIRLIHFRMASIVKSLRLLADETRLRLLLLLQKEELSVVEIQEVLGMGQSRISSHLAQLRQAGLVRDRRAGKNIYYALRRRSARTRELRSIIEAAAPRNCPRPRATRPRCKLALQKARGQGARIFQPARREIRPQPIARGARGKAWRTCSSRWCRRSSSPTSARAKARSRNCCAKRAKKVIAIDNSEKMVEFGAALAKKHGFKNLEYRLGEIEDPPIPAGSVDLALLSQALHHAGQPARAIAAAHRILKSGGRIAVLDLLAHQFEQARELYADLWLGFSEAELHRTAGGGGIRAGRGAGGRAGGRGAALSDDLWDRTEAVDFVRKFSIGAGGGFMVSGMNRTPFLAALLLLPAAALSARAATSDLQQEYVQVRKIALKDARVQEAFQKANERLNEKILEIDPSLKPIVEGAHLSSFEGRGSEHRAAPAHAATAGTTHVVAAGETLGSIAAKYKVTVAALKKANHVTDERKLPVGQKLVIPSGAAG